MATKNPLGYTSFSNISNVIITIYLRWKNFIILMWRKMSLHVCIGTGKYIKTHFTGNICTYYFCNNNEDTVGAQRPDA